MRRFILIVSLLVFLIASFVSAKSLIFYESFDNISSIYNNNGTITGSPTFTKGVRGNSINFTGNKRVCYPIPGNFNETNGTIEFWVKPPPEDYKGFFDIGWLQYPNSWGIFKNVNYLIMEVKNRDNIFDQAWSINPWIYDAKWHFVAAVWEMDYNNCTYFKVFLDGEGKLDYDGLECNSFPNMTRNFCLGWCGWYGYSQSLMDEVKIYDYVKADEEIKEDYLSMVNYTKENRTRKECKMYKPESKGSVKINCSGLYINNEPFTAKGVGYQPIPIGKTAESLQHKQEMYNDPRIYRDRDFPLLRKMNANTIRTWGEVMNKTFLDAAWNNGIDPIYIIMGFWINCGENYGDPAIIQKYISNFTKYVIEYKDHPAVLAWGLGNENNLAYCSSSQYIDDFYSLSNELARVAYEIEGENYHPVGVINGDIFYIGIDYYKADDLSMNYTDFWGSNVYPGETFGDWFEDYAALSGKPLLITEYGIDALNNTNKEEYEDVHAEWVLRQWKEINASNVTIGSTLMAYSDEWWKAGYPNSHDYGGYTTTKHPDGYGNEEWWGVMRIKKNLSGGVDIMEPRKLYYALQYAWGEKINFNLSLNQGWNLISIPLAIQRIPIESVFNDSIPIYAYNGSWFVPDYIDNKLGYWIKLNKSINLDIIGTEVRDDIDLKQGWNLIGHPYLIKKNVSELFNNNIVYSYNGSWSSYIPNKTSNTLQTLKPGYGYWVKK